jgi:DNA-binding NarL/FixJ family response regulator
MDQIAVMIVDDHEVVRDGLRWMLETDEHVHIVGEAANGVEALEVVDKLLPNVILMDIKMPIMDGLTATKRLKEEHPNVHVVIMTSYGDDVLVMDAIRAGASGYLLKDASKELVISTISAVASGGILVNAKLLRRTMSEGSSRAEAEMEQMGLVEPLTERERTVLQRLAAGHTNKEIGNSLGYAEVTVKKHVQVILAKLHASNRTHAVSVATRFGLMD